MMATSSQSTNKENPRGFAANEMFKAAKKLMIGKEFIRKVKEKIMKRKQTETVSSKEDSEDSSPNNIEVYKINILKLSNLTIF